jgi:hypothetical protein
MQKLAKRKTYTVTVEEANPPGDLFAVRTWRATS